MDSLVPNRHKIVNNKQIQNFVEKTICWKKKHYCQILKIMSYSTHYVYIYPSTLRLGDFGTNYIVF
jgi:hypothetical protein